MHLFYTLRFRSKFCGGGQCPLCPPPLSTPLELLPILIFDPLPQCLLMQCICSWKRLLNRLRSQHIDYKSNKMKTSLAAQTLSKSVAKSIQYCDEVKKNPAFRDSEGTVRFLLIMNDMFDLLNSKSKFGKKVRHLCAKKILICGLKSLMSIQNRYLLSLKHVNGQLLVKGPRKSAFMGFVVTMKSIMYIYQCYVKTNHLQYLLTFKFSQDHLGITVSFEIFD